MKKILLSLQTKIEGDVAQLVEQRTENPCVGGSIPSFTTHKLRPVAAMQRAFFITKHEGERLLI